MVGHSAVLGLGQVHLLLALGAGRLHREPHVLHSGLHVADHVAHGVGSVAIADVHGVHAVALGLGHRHALAVEDLGVEEHVGEGQVSHVVEPQDHHSGHPQGQNVPSGHQARARIVVIEGARLAAARGQAALSLEDLRGLGVGPAQGREGPERGAEPGVEHVGVAGQAELLEGCGVDRVVVFAAEAHLELEGPELGLGLGQGQPFGDRVLGPVVVADPGLEPLAGAGVGSPGEGHGCSAHGLELLGLEALPPHGDPVAPPQLARDAPVPLLGQPGGVGPAVAIRVGVEVHLQPARRAPLAVGGVYGCLRQAWGLEGLIGALAAGHPPLHVAHPHEPLLAEVGLDRRLGAVRVTDLDLAVLNLGQEAQGVEVRHHALARREAIVALIVASVGVEGPVVVEDVDGADLEVALPHHVVVRIVGRRDLHAARAELRLGPLVEDQRDLSVHEREHDRLAGLGHGHELEEVGEVRLAARLEAFQLGLGVWALLVVGLGQLGASLLDEAVEGLLGVRVRRHRRVAEHRLGAGRSHGHELGLSRTRVVHWIAEVPEVPLHRLVVELVVGHSCLEVTIPVHQARAAEDQLVAEQTEEALAHRRAAHLVSREALAIPVAGGAHRALLAHDPRLVLVLPLPDPVHEGLAADVVASQALLLLEPLLHHSLGRDPGVVGARLPERVLALHSVPADQEVLAHVVHGVAHVEGAGHVRERHHDHVALITRAFVWDRLEGLGV